MNQTTTPVNAAMGSPGNAMAFTFGDAVPVLDGRDILGLAESWWNGRYYEPPISFSGLAKCLVANSHHRSAVAVKVNILSSCFVPAPSFSRAAFKRAALDYVVFGNTWLECRRSWLGRPLEILPSLAKHTRLMKGDQALMLIDGVEHEFAPGSTFHLAQPDVNQERYGVPDYMGALQSLLLNENATLFRRKYYINGSHAGFILYMTDAAQNLDDVNNLRQALKESKGPGNFRNLFMYSPNGKPDGLKIIPIAEVMAKDEFLSIKNVTRDDVLAAHRVPPQLLGILPNNTGGFGDVEKAAAVFARNELRPIMDDFLAINDWLGEPVISFQDYEVRTATA